MGRVASIKLIALCLLLPVAAASAALGERAAKQTRCWLDLVTGIYEGAVIDGGRPVPQTVRLTRDANGQLIGTYTVHQEEEYEGQLVDGRVDGPYTLSFTWKDRHGEGVISFVFKPDGSAFGGCWGLAQVDPSLTVSGRRRVR